MNPEVIYLHIINYVPDTGLMLDELYTAGILGDRDKVKKAAEEGDFDITPCLRIKNFQVSPGEGNSGLKISFEVHPLTDTCSYNGGNDTRTKPEHLHVFAVGLPIDSADWAESALRYILLTVERGLVDTHQLKLHDGTELHVPTYRTEQRFEVDEYAITVKHHTEPKDGLLHHGFIVQRHAWDE